MIVVDQMPKLLGLHFPKGPFLSDINWQFFMDLQGLDSHRRRRYLGPATVLQRFIAARSAPLVTVAIAIAATNLFGLGDLGVQTVGHGCPQACRR